MWSTSKSVDAPQWVAFYQGTTRTAYVVDNGIVSQLVAEGSFRTPEGITERSTNPDIWRAYGEPDVFWYTRGARSWSLSNIAFPLVMLLGGIVAGYLLRVYHRREAAGRLPVTILIPLLLGAGSATVSATIGFWIVAGYQIPMLLYPAIVVTSFVIGLLVTGIFEAMGRWSTSLLRHIAVLVLMVLGALLAEWVVFLLYPKGIVTWSIIWSGILHSLFSLGLLLSVKLRRSSEENQQQANSGL